MRDDALLSLHLWRDADAASAWRARVTDLRGGAVATFADVPALVRYLSEAFGAGAGTDASPPTSDGDDADA